MTKFAQFFAALEPGNTLFIPGASAEPRELVEAISSCGDALPPIEIINSFVPAINPTPLARENNQLTETVIFPRSSAMMQQDRVQLQPISYYGFDNYLSTRSVDWACLQVSPPDAQGYCSLGYSIEFIPTVLGVSKRILGLINPNVPAIKGAPKIHVDRIDLSIEIASPLVTYQARTTDKTSAAISDHLATLIESGAVLQLGLGNIPNQLSDNLAQLRRLRFHSGMLSDGFLQLLQSGALDTSFRHTTCCALGSSEFYYALQSLENVVIDGVSQTHAPQTLSALDHLIAINSALEVDLWGQANLEMANQRQLSSIGGCPDFARAARNNRKGKSIVALPATAEGGKTSRICATLKPGHVASLARCDVDYVVTEYGIACLKGRSIAQRGSALINIAAPAFRDALQRSWCESLSRI